MIEQHVLALAILDQKRMSCEPVVQKMLQQTGTKGTYMEPF